MGLIPSGYHQKYYFVYGQCSEIHVTIKEAFVPKLVLFLYDEFTRDYCSLDFSICGNTVTCIKRINHITEFNKKLELNFREVYTEVKNCLLQYLPECTYAPHEKTFESFCEKICGFK